jgi:hypothetical protein
MRIKSFYILFILILIGKNASSQSDGCGAGASLLTPGAPGAACAAVAGSTSAGFTDSNQGCAAGTEDDDGWYRFVATATSHTITVDGAANMDAILGIYSVCGGAQPTGGACVDATLDGGIETRTVTGLTIGNTYFICIHDWYAGGGDFTICITTPAAPPANDACSTPTSLTPAAPGAACAPVAGSSLTATLSGQGCTLGNEDDDVWYSFVATASTHVVTVDGAANMDAVLGVYSTCAGAQPTGGNCVDATSGNGNETVTVSGLTIGNTYLVCIYDFAAGGGDFTVCVTTPVVLANDDCSGAITVACGNTYTGSTSSATSATDPSALCGVTPDGDGVWYVFPGDGNSITASLCGSGYDTQINVYSGSCGALGCISGNDDFCGTSSQTTFTSTLGVNYYILVNGNSGASGNYTLAITCAVPPSATAQDCGGGITICSNTSFSGNSNGGGNYNDFTAANTDCLDPPEHQTSWYYFSSTTNGTIGMTITPALTTDDYDWAIWGPLASVTCPPAAAPIRCSAADGNGTPANITGLRSSAADVSEGPFGDGWTSVLNVLAGEIYIMVLDNWTASNSAFTLSWQLSNGANLNCVPLPVELVSFTGKRDGSKNKLEWSTLSEINSDIFTVERSVDGILFDAIGEKDAAGNASTRNDYFFLDNSPIKGSNYYRLKQTDLDGSSVYSAIIVIENKTEEIIISNIHPNPTDNELNFDINSSINGDLIIQIVDITGRVLISETHSINQGESLIRTEMEELANGLYSLKVELKEGNFRSVTKVVKY